MRVALLATVWWQNSSADWLSRKMWNGYDEDGGEGPPFELASAYLDDIDRLRAEELCKEHGVPLFPTIEGALTLASGKLAVDGIFLVAAQGRYSRNDAGQNLLPHAVFWEKVRSVFALDRTVCPVFSPNLLATTWVDAKDIYDRCHLDGVPLMTGTCYPLAFRDGEMPKGGEVKLGVAVSSSHVHNRQEFGHFAKHALEMLQYQMERRAGGETGVESVRCLSGSGMWPEFDKAVGDEGVRLLEHTLTRLPQTTGGDYRAKTAAHPQAALVVVRYRDGATGVMAHLDGFNVGRPERDILFSGGGAGLRYHLQPQGEQDLHYTRQLRAVVEFFETSVSPVPLERTLLCNGILDAAMRSRADGGKIIDTPWLSVVYKTA